MYESRLDECDMLGLEKKAKAVISIITPVYNVGEIIFETFKSIRQQTFQSFEWILVNDGSVDEITLKIVADISTKDDKIKVIHHANNKGLPAARNTGIKNSSAPYIFFLDGDDLIDPTFLEKAYLFLLQNQEFAFINSYVIGFGAQEYKWTGGFHERELFLKENRNTSCFMARREVFETVVFDETMRDGCEDWEFWIHAAAKGFWGYTIPEYLFYYRRSAENKWATMQGKEALAQIQKSLQEKYGAVLTGNFPDPQLTDYSFGYTAPEIPILDNSKKYELHLLCIFPWLQIGGSDQYNLNLLKGLKEKGWQITIVTTLHDDHTWEEKFKELTEDIFHLSHLGKESAYAPYVNYLIETRSPNLVFLSNSMYGYYLLPYLKIRFPQLPVVDYIHCEDMGWYKGGYPYFSALYNGFLSKTYTTSHNLSQWCVQNGGDKEKLEVCYINVDTLSIKRNEESRNRIRAELGLQSEIPLILFVARLTAQKQPVVLIDTLAVLKEKGKKFYAVIIGDGPDRTAMEASIDTHSLSDKVCYLGSKSNEVVLQYMDAADIFFLPSLYEGIALSIYEAMAKELTIVGAAVGGQAELVNEECGFLIDRKSANKDVKKYVNVLSELLDNPSKIHQYGKNSRKRVEHFFNLQGMIEQMHTSFLKISNKVPNAETFSTAYVQLLNRMLHLEKERSLALEFSDSKIVRLLNRYKRPYHKLRNVYLHLKTALKR